MFVGPESRSEPNILPFPHSLIPVPGTDSYTM